MSCHPSLCALALTSSALQLSDDSGDVRRKRREQVCRVSHAKLGIVFFIGLCIGLSALTSACSNPDPEDVEWRVAGDESSSDSHVAIQPSSEDVLGFFTASQSLDGVSTNRSIWWDGEMLRQYRNGQLLAKATCRAVPLAERRTTLRCEAMRIEDDGGVEDGPDTDGVAQRPIVVPLESLDRERLVHRATPQVIYRRREVPADLREAQGGAGEPEINGLEQTEQ